MGCGGRIVESMKDGVVWYNADEGGSDAVSCWTVCRFRAVEECTYLCVLTICFRVDYFDNVLSPFLHCT